jgi:hypothetical protein
VKTTCSAVTSSFVAIISVEKTVAVVPARIVFLSSLSSFAESAVIARVPAPVTVIVLPVAVSVLAIVSSSSFSNVNAVAAIEATIQEVSELEVVSKVTINVSVASASISILNPSNVSFSLDILEPETLSNKLESETLPLYNDTEAISVLSIAEPVLTLSSKVSSISLNEIEEASPALISNCRATKSAAPSTTVTLAKGTFETETLASLTVKFL